jgi:hypothetical protein
MQTELEINQLSPDERHTLARKAKTSYIYLLQMASGIRTPSLNMADRLITLEPRLTIKTLLAPKRRRDALLKKRPK